MNKETYEALKKYESVDVNPRFKPFKTVGLISMFGAVIAILAFLFLVAIKVGV